MKLSIVIPCYNEINSIKCIIDAVEKCPYNPKEIIIVDDCSTDGTKEKLQGLRGVEIERIIYLNHNQGKGAAARTGIKAASGDIIIIQDADLEYNPVDIPIMIQPILDDKADVVYSSRFLGAGPHRVLYFWHMVGNKFLTTLSNMLTNLNLTDMESGYKAFRSEIIKSIEIKENSFGFEPEITAKIAKSKCRIYEVGISYSGRTYAEGKKVNWKDGFSAIRCILKYNLIG